MAVAAAAPAHAADFLKAIEDVPLPKGMTEQAEPVVFESEQGRVVKTDSRGPGRLQRDRGLLRHVASGARLEAAPKDRRRSSFERESERLTISSREPRFRPTRRRPSSFELVVKLASTRLPE